MEQKKIIYGIEEISTVVDTIKHLLPRCAVFTFTGSLGAGKTTLIKALLASCGVQEVVTSPTFTYVNIYHTSMGTFYHFDLYRIGSLDEFCAAGFDEYLYASNSWALIEWPAAIMPLLKHKVCNINIDYLGQEQREASLICIK